MVPRRRRALKAREGANALVNKLLIQIINIETWHSGLLLVNVNRLDSRWDARQTLLCNLTRPLEDLQLGLGHKVQWNVGYNQLVIIVRFQVGQR